MLPFTKLLLLWFTTSILSLKNYVFTFAECFKTMLLLFILALLSYVFTILEFLILTHPQSSVNIDD